jgi:hypothetical protein
VTGPDREKISLRGGGPPPPLRERESRRERGGGGGGGREIIDNQQGNKCADFHSGRVLAVPSPTGRHHLKSPPPRLPPPPPSPDVHPAAALRDSVLCLPTDIHSLLVNTPSSSSSSSSSSLPPPPPPPINPPPPPPPPPPPQPSAKATSVRRRYLTPPVTWCMCGRGRQRELRTEQQGSHSQHRPACLAPRPDSTITRADTQAREPGCSKQQGRWCKRRGSAGEADGRKNSYFGTLVCETALPMCVEQRAAGPRCIS